MIKLWLLPSLLQINRWGKRAAHNRAQVTYYLAENLELRREEFAVKISKLTGKKMTEALDEVDASVKRLFHWGGYCDKYGGTLQVSQRALAC